MVLTLQDDYCVGLNHPAVNMASGTRLKFYLMVPNKGILPKIDNLVFEYKPSHQTLQLGKTISLGLNLRKPKGESYVYAPEPARASVTAYYLQVVINAFAKLFEPQIRAGNSSVFVSVSLVKDLINGEDEKWTEKCP